MLVLSRKCGQKVILPQSGVVLTVLEVRGQSVRIGITAPERVKVHRQEVWMRLRQADARGADCHSPAPPLVPSTPPSATRNPQGR